MPRRIAATLCAALALQVSCALVEQRVALGAETTTIGRKVELVAFMQRFKEHVDANVFAVPEKLNEVIPMTIEWRPPEEVRGDAPWMIARSVVLRTPIFRADQISYRLRTGGRWKFSLDRVEDLACLGFDDVIAVWGRNYQVAPMLHRHYPHLPPGSPIARPGPQKMAGEGLIYKLPDPSAEKQISLRFSFNGCVESFDASRVF